MMINAMLGVLAVLLTVLAPQPAQAAEDYPQGTMPASQAIIWPLETHDVVVQGPWDIKRMRVTAKYIDDRVPGLTIHAERGVKCSDYPDATCVTVKYRNTDGTSCAEPTGLNRVIWLDTGGFESTWFAWQHTSGHELMHVLGFTHHREFGLVGVGDTPRRLTTAAYVLPTMSEINALNNTYRADR